MVYEYEKMTGFFPTAQTETLSHVDDYVRSDDLEMIRFPQMEVHDIYREAWFIWGKEVWNIGRTIRLRGDILSTKHLEEVS